MKKELDAISRTKALFVLESMKDKSAKGDISCFYNKIIDDCKTMIRGLENVEPTQVIATVKFSEDDLRKICKERIEFEFKAGHWEEYATTIRCSECGTEFDDDIHNMVKSAGKITFCPCCGTRMEGRYDRGTD